MRLLRGLRLDRQAVRGRSAVHEGGEQACTWSLPSACFTIGGQLDARATSRALQLSPDMAHCSR